MESFSLFYPAILFYSSIMLQIFSSTGQASDPTGGQQYDKGIETFVKWIEDKSRLAQLHGGY